MKKGMIANSLVHAAMGQAGVMLEAFTQHSEGLLNDEQFNGACITYRAWLREIGFRQFVLSLRSGVNMDLAPKFSAFVEGLITDAPAGLRRHRRR